MKTILLLIALTGFTAVGSYAQNKDCCCKHKTTANHIAYKKPAVVSRVPLKEKDPTCFMLKKENLGIPGCMDVTYNGSNDYLGYNAKRLHSTPKIVKPQRATVTTQAEAEKPMFKKVENEPIRPCYTYTQHNIVVKECPGKFYDNNKMPLISAPIEYNTTNTYMGYYPDKETNETKTYENASGNLCLWDCK